MAPCYQPRQSSIEARDKSSKNIVDKIPLIASPLALMALLIIGWWIFMAWKVRGARQAYLDEFEPESTRGSAPSASATQPESAPSSAPPAYEECEPKTGQDSVAPANKEASEPAE